MEFKLLSDIFETFDGIKIPLILVPLNDFDSIICKLESDSIKTFVRFLH